MVFAASRITAIVPTIQRGNFSRMRPGEPHPGHHADARRHHLHAAHERPGHERRPQKGGAELGADDRVGRHPRWIIVRGARRHSGAQCLQDALDACWQFLRATWS